MSNRLIDTLQQTRLQRRIALCGYFLIGYPNPDRFYRLVRAACDLDVIEYGIPADEPSLDGPVIARAHEVVTRQRGIHAEPALALLGGLADVPQPSFVMTYAAVGRSLDGFLQLCVKNGVSGVLAPDIDREEGAMVAAKARALGLASITLLDARTPDDALQWNVAHGDLIYIKAALGKTGESIEIDGAVRDLLQQVVRRARAIKPDVLLAVGIGLQKPEQIAALARLDVDMAIVGTRLVEHSQQGEAALAEYLKALRRATVREEQWHG